MNSLVKKEIRLLLPSWMVAVLLAMVQGITRPYDFYVASLLFFGLTIMALTTIGREASLNTFSSLLLAQPAERVRVWQIKISVLAAAFLIVLVVWLAAFGIAFSNSHVDASDREDSYNLCITVCLIAAATFTGGLWTTLLLRQLAGAFWLTLLVPATLSGFSGIFLAGSESGNFVIAILSLVIGIYSIAGFLFARWLFFRAQDVGWSGGVIAMPEWKFLSARAEGAGSVRTRKPIFALIKKEFQLQQVSLLGAAGLLVLHIGTIVLRAVHHFDEKSAGAIFIALFWMLWLVMAPVIGSMSVAEERRLGVLEGQLCQPVSRRIQFVIKAFLTLFLGIFLAGIVPVLMEIIGARMGGGQSVLARPENGYWELAIVASAAWLVLVSFFASTLANSFLQAVGFGVATFFGCMLVVPLFTSGRMLFLDSISTQHILPLIIAVPTIIVTLLWLAYLNFNNFRDGWPLARSNVGGILGALLFIFVSSNVFYHRAWEVFEPAEPPHGPARLSAAEPPKLLYSEYTLSALLPDGRLWTEQSTLLSRGRIVADLKTQQFIGGSNWVDVALNFYRIAGIQSDGSLWSAQTHPGNREAPAYPLTRIGSDTDWSHVASGYGFLLLKTNGTLWYWGIDRNGELRWDELKKYLPIPPRRISGETNWTEVFGRCARKSDGSLWIVEFKGLKTNGAPQLLRIPEGNDWFRFTSRAIAPNAWEVGVKTNGELWLILEQENQKPKAFQLGKNAKWKAVAFAGNEEIGISMITLRSDGTLWQWQSPDKLARYPDSAKPAQLGTYSDWIALVPAYLGDSGSVALAADGGLWAWKNPDQHFWLAPSRKPVSLGNIFGKAD